MKKNFLLGALVLILALGFTGCPTEDPEEKTFDGYTLKVSGLPSVETGYTYGASLMLPSAPAVPVAIGWMGDLGSFEFYHPKAADSGIPIDFDKPFKTPGTYLFALAKANLSTFTEETVYMYGGNNNGQITFSATDSHMNVDWADFPTGGGLDNFAGTKVTVTGAPAEAAVLSVVNGGTPVAVGMRGENDTYSLTEMDMTTPWKGTGAYMIVLAKTDQTPIAMRTSHAFAANDSITLAYSTDFNPVP
jgi:hypothetical protein